jgi:hypothetical protein
MLTSLTLLTQSLVLSALLLMMSGTPLLAQADFAPKHPTEMIAPAATVVSTVHYQAQIALTCVGSGCQGSFATPGANHRLNVTRISCYMRGPSGATYEWGEAELQNETNNPLFSQYLPADFTGADGSQLINRAVDVRVSANQHLLVRIQLANFQAYYAYCSATGTKETLG